MTNVCQSDSQQIEDFCVNLRTSLLSALERRDQILVQRKEFTREVLLGSEHGDLSGHLYTGTEIEISIGEPAAKLRTEIEQKRVVFISNPEIK